jgi:tetratricopeptide (TPR) repeat protein
VKQIGEDLGVDYILEGSVRWAKTADGRGRVRITPQLVRVSDDTSIWHETYDREVTDIFDVQTEIANHVVDALGVTLQSGERERLGAQPTSSLEAYELYMRARTSTVARLFCRLREGSFGRSKKPCSSTPIPGRLVRPLHMHSLIYHSDVDRSGARLPRAESALDRADTIDSSSPLTQVARGFYYYYGFRDYDRALTEFEAALRQRPNDAEARGATGLIYRRQGQWDAAVRASRESTELDPQNINTIMDLADTYDSIRRPDLAMECYERALATRFDNSVIADGSGFLRHDQEPRRPALVARAKVGGAKVCRGRTSTCKERNYTR